MGATLAIIILCGLALGGCDVADKLGELFRIGGNGEAEAQPAGERIIEMFAIDLATFVLQTDDTPPTIDVQDGFTKYTIQAATMNPRLNFTRLDGDTFTNTTLEADDEVIVRPTVGTVDLAVGTVTLNRQR